MNTFSYYKRVVSGFWRYSYLLSNLVKKDFALKYRRSFLGVLWSVLNPLLMAAVISIVFSNIFRFDIENFSIYYLVGSLIFNYIVEATSSSLISVVSSSSLVNKVYVPKYIFPLEKCLFSLVNSMFSFVAIIVVMPFLGVIPPVSVLLFWIPVLCAFVFSVGLGMVLSSVNIFFRDIGHLWAVWTMAWMYLTPIFYPMSILPPSLQSWLNYNPAYRFIDYARQVILYGTIPNFEATLICCVWAISSILVGLIVFKKSQDKFILYM